MNRIHFILSLSCIVSFLSCTRVEIAPEGTEMTTTAKLAYTWDEDCFLKGEAIPDSMTVFMSRAIETIHYQIVSDKTGYISSSNAPVDTASHRLFNVDHGKYYVLSMGLGVSSDSTERYDFSHTDNFASDRSKAIGKMTATLRRDSVHTIFANLYTTYVEASPLLLEYEEVNLEDYSREHEISLLPSFSTIELGLRLCFNLERGVKVKKVSAILSGIPSTIWLSERAVNKDNVGQIYVDLTYDEELSGTYSVPTFSSTFETLGLFAPQSSDIVSGAGILTLFISYDNNGEDAKSLIGINLKDKIDKAALMTTSDDVNYHVAKRKHSFTLTLSVDSHKKNFTLVGEDSIKYWYIDYEEENPKLYL